MPHISSHPSSSISIFEKNHEIQNDISMGSSKRKNLSKQQQINHLHTFMEIERKKKSSKLLSLLGLPFKKNDFGKQLDTYLTRYLKEVEFVYLAPIPLSPLSIVD